MSRLRDEYLTRTEQLVDIVEQYKARNGTYPRDATTDLVERIPSVIDELRSLRALLATPMPRWWPAPVPGVAMIDDLHRSGPVVTWEALSDEPYDADEICALGAALIRAALEARGGE